MNTKSHLLILAGFGFWLFTINLGGYDLWPPDEPRFAQVSREMIASGDYLAPHINGEPYTEKPPLFFWLIAAVSAPFGDVTELSARIPSALSGVATVLLTYLLAQRLYGTTTAFWSGLILMTFQRFWWQARFAQIDMTLTACLTAAFLCFWLWHTEHRTRYLIGFYAAIAAGILAKGPPALVFPLLTAIVFYWGRRPERRQLHLVIGLLAAIGIALLWLIPARMAIAPAETVGAHDQIGSNLYRQIIGRFFLGVSHDRPFYYYLINLPADLFPWTLCLPWTVLWAWNHRRDGDRMRFLLSWTLPAILFFSLSAGKRALYLLPLHPALAILMACSVMALMEGDYRRWRTSIAGAWAAILFGASLAPFSLFFTEYADTWSNWFVLVSAAAILCGIQTVWNIRQNCAKLIGRDFVVHFGILSTLLATIVFPSVDLHKSAKEFCEPLRNLSQKGDEYRLYSYGFSREEYIFYAEHFHTFVPVLPVRIEGMGSEEHGRLNRALANSFRGLEKDYTLAPQPLVDALAGGYAASGLSADMIQAHRAAVRAELNEFFTSTVGSEPAYIIMQIASWQQMLAYFPADPPVHLISNEHVGSRHVVLLANDSGRDLLLSAGAGIPSPGASFDRSLVHVD